MTKSMSQAREEYEATIDNLMAGLATAREVQASRSMSGGSAGASGGVDSQSRALTRSTDSRSSAYSIPEAPRSHHTRRSSGDFNSKTSTIEENKPYTSRYSSRGGVSSSAYANIKRLSGEDHTGKESLGSKKELAVDIENMTIASELTDHDSGTKVDHRSSASSTLRDLTKTARSRSSGRSRSIGQNARESIIPWRRGASFRWRFCQEIGTGSS